MRRILIAILTILLLSSCGTVNTNVTVFHELTPEPQTFAFIQLKEQEGSLEHKRYEELVRSKLVQRGYKEVQLSEADYVIGMIYGIGSQLVTSSYPIFGQTGVSSSTTYGTVYGNTGTFSATTNYNPTYGVVDSGTSTSKKYTRGLNLTFYDKKYFDEHSKIRAVYEAKVVSEGSVGELSIMMPYLVDALFQNFPGNNGSTRRVTLRFDKNR